MTQTKDFIIFYLEKKLYGNLKLVIPIVGFCSDSLSPKVISRDLSHVSILHYYVNAIHMNN